MIIQDGGVRENFEDTNIMFRGFKLFFEGVEVPFKLNPQTGEGAFPINLSRAE